jgi:hypothetical protein
VKKKVKIESVEGRKEINKEYRDGGKEVIKEQDQKST